MRQIDARNMAKVLMGLGEDDQARVLTVLNELESLTGTKWYPDSDMQIPAIEETQWAKPAETKVSVVSENSLRF